MQENDHLNRSNIDYITSFLDSKLIGAKLNCIHVEEDGIEIYLHIPGSDERENGCKICFDPCWSHRISYLYSASIRRPDDHIEDGAVGLCSILSELDQLLGEAVTSYTLKGSTFTMQIGNRTLFAPGYVIRSQKRRNESWWYLHIDYNTDLPALVYPGDS